MPNYRMESRDLAGNYTATLPFRNLQGEWFKNKSSQIRFDLPMYHQDVDFTRTYPRKFEIWLYRDDILVFAGPLMDMTLDTSEASITCGASSLESYYDSRIVAFWAASGDYYYSGSVATAMHAMSTATQAQTSGNFRITQGTNEDVVHAITTLKVTDGKYITDFFDDCVAMVGGPDWWVDPITRQLNIVASYGRALTSVIEYGGVIKQFSMQIMGEYTKNVIQARGANDTQYLAEDTGSMSEYGRYEYIAEDTSETDANNLAAYAGQIVALRAQPKFVPSVVAQGTEICGFTHLVNGVSTAPDLEWGDTIRVVIDTGPLTYDAIMQCVGFQLTVSKQMSETFVFYMNPVDDVGDDLT